MPPAPILEAALGAARRGVDVRLLTCGRSDVPLVQYAGRRLYPVLLEAGVRVWEHERDILHAKFFVADGRRTIIGSYNADRWGQRYNQEVAAEIESEELAAGLAECFHRGATVEITRETIEAWPWYVMFVARLLWILSRILAPDASHRARRQAKALPGPASTQAGGIEGDQGDEGDQGNRGDRGYDGLPQPSSPSPPSSPSTLT
jgi:phosphatidylserine/phosphatidylglycerophosphate/cardiolipin synthase-like enzyme